MSFLSLHKQSFCHIFKLLQLLPLPFIEPQSIEKYLYVDTVSYFRVMTIIEYLLGLLQCITLPVQTDRYLLQVQSRNLQFLISSISA